MEKARYLLVAASAVPEVFVKVMEAKRLLARGDAHTMAEAARMAGISRSAFYKYKDSVFAYKNEKGRRIITLFFDLLDEPGVLSSVLAKISGRGGNVLTINQNIPLDGVAPVSVSVSSESMDSGREEWLEELRSLYGVVNLRMLAEE